MLNFIDYMCCNFNYPVIVLNTCRVCWCG